MFVYDLTCHRLQEPKAIARAPELSWKLRSEKENDAQTAYQLRIFAEHAKDTPLWDSGKVCSDETLDIVPDISLSAFTKYIWDVRVWDRDGEVSAYSAPAYFETGPLTMEDWSAGWISVTDPETRENRPQSFGPFVENPQPTEVYYFRGMLSIPEGSIQRARLYLASEQSCYVHFGGTDLTEWLTGPMTRNMKKRLLFVTCDVTNLTRPGELLLGIESLSGNVMAQLVVTYQDGNRHICGTHERFTFWSGSRTQAPLESGEMLDMTREPVGWDTQDYGAEDWKPVYPGHCPSPKLEPNTYSPMNIRKRIHPKTAKQMPDGAWVFAGEEITVGRFVFSGSAPAGTEITITMSEQLNPDGSLFYLKNSFVPEVSVSVATNFYTFAGTGRETFAPHFAFSSFQYIEVRGYPGALTTEDIWFETIGTPVRRTSEFRCSNDLFNILYENMCRTVENDAHDGLGSTYLDEKGTFIGGDASFAGEAILYTQDIVPIFRQETGIQLDGQLEDGAFREPGQPAGVPGHPSTTPEWDSTALHLTKYMDDYAGLRRNTAEKYEALKQYMAAELRELQKNDYLEDSNTGGDWNSPEAEFAPEDGLISGSACDYRCYEFLIEMARWLGREEDIPAFEREKANIAEAINRRFLKGDCYETDTTEYVPLYGGPMGWAKAPKEKIPVGYRQASNLFPLVYGITPEQKKHEVFGRLVRDIHEKGDHLHTGAIASKYLLTYLTEMGRLELAYDIANKRDFPSWGFWVEQGATTMWEHWRFDSRSRNHFFLGAGIQEWFFKSLAGFQNMTEGFKTVDIRPSFPEKLDSFYASIDTCRGTFSVQWQRVNGKIELTVTVPPNVQAAIFAPGMDGKIVGSGKYRLRIS